MQFIYGNTLGKVVVGVHPNGQPINGHRKLNELDSGFSTLLFFAGLDGPGGVVDIDVSGSKLLETAASARYSDYQTGRTTDGFSPIFDHCLSDGKDRAGTVNICCSRTTGDQKAHGAKKSRPPSFPAQRTA